MVRVLLAIASLGMVAAAVGAPADSANAPAVDATATSVPTVEQVLAICRENRAKLDPLHFQSRLVEERTEAYGESQLLQAKGLEQLLAMIEKGNGVGELEAQMPGISSEAYRQSLRDQVKTSQELAQPFRSEDQFEFFIAGDNYQVRSPVGASETTFAFPTAAVTAESLTDEFAHVRIYSRSAAQSPPGQIWQGQSHPERQVFATTTNKHFGDTQSTRLPPFTDALHASTSGKHPIDVFLGAPPDRFRTVGQESREGRLLTIVDVVVPTDLQSGRIGADGKPEQFKLAYEVRAWLDLERGGIPLLMQMWIGSEGEKFDERFRATPWRVLATTDVKEVNGGFYPARTVEEEFNSDPKLPPLTAEEWADVRVGKREPPPQVVFQRQTWKCTAIDTNPLGGDEFFVLSFPSHAARFDLDARQVAGALETSPPIPPGDPAPPLSIARWLDGQQHTLEEFRGKVVVLHFWGFSCSGCIRGIPGLNALQLEFDDQSVVFISIHDATHDVDNLAGRIEKLAQEKQWCYLAAIDSGTMAQDSASFHAYGCTGQPTDVIIGPDGRVAWHSGIAPAGMEGIVGKTSDQITPEDEVKINKYMQAEFEAAGETWPQPEALSDEEEVAISNRMIVFQLGRHIKAALP
jgi:thiol-disulfide isomerase/thioredoxin